MTCGWCIASGVVVGGIILLYVYLKAIAFKPPTVTLRNSHIAITGGSSGIGLAAAHQCIEGGAKHVVIIGSSKAKLDTAVNELKDAAKAKAVNGQTTTVTGIQADVSQPEVKKTIENHVKDNGPLDVMIANAGISRVLKFEGQSPEVFDQIMRVNYLGCVHSAMGCLEGMKERRKGRIILVASMAGQAGVIGYASYSPSKFALRGFAEVLSMEVQKWGIGVTVVNPPDVDTPQLQADKEEMLSETAKISEGSGVWEPKVIARNMLAAIDNYTYCVNFGIDGLMLGTVTVGMAPVTSPAKALVEVLLLPLFRLIASGYVWSWYRLVRKN